MPIHNQDIARLFNLFANLLDIQGGNLYRVRAYRNAVLLINNYPRSIAEMVANNEDLTQLPGIGKDLAERIKEIVITGELTPLKNLETQVPFGLVELLSIPGLGPKRILAIRKALNINNLEDLRKAAEEGKIRELYGFGEKTEKKILEEIRRIRHSEKRYNIADVEDEVKSLLEYLRGMDEIKKVEAAGSYRRRSETVGDIDMLAISDNGEKAMEYFSQYEDIAEVISRGETRATVLLRSGLQVDLRVVPEESYGAALHYFTGSKAHNIAIRRLAQERGLKINEYGVFRKLKYIAGRTEKEVYAVVNMPYIEPELRENRGEIEAALQRKLPNLVTLRDIKGDLHIHTNATDGHNTLEEMIQGARIRGYDYLAITDHTKRVSVARGLTAEQILERNREIDKFNGKYTDIVILKSAEVDILEDGSLDLPDEVLKQLDLTVCSIHYHRNKSRAEQTRRIIKAMDNPYFTILAHPMGRLIGEREPYDLDIEAVLRAAKARGKIVELDGHPMRLDLPDIYVKMAKEMGVIIAVSTDSHSITELRYMRYGIDQARRGWLEAKNVLNTFSLEDLKKRIAYSRTRRVIRKR